MIEQTEGGMQGTGGGSLSTAGGKGARTAAAGMASHEQGQAGASHPHAVGGRAIFVGGVARSGTTLMRVLLNRHHDIAAFGETKLAEWTLFRRFPHWIVLSPEASRRQQLEIFKRLCLTRFYSYRVGHCLPRRVLLAWRGFDDWWLHRFQRRQSAWTRSPFLVALEKLWLAEPIQCRTFGRRVPQDREQRWRWGLRGLCGFFQRSEIEACFPLLMELEDLHSEEQACRVYGGFWGALFQTYATRRGKRYWAEKTPANTVHARFFAMCYEDLKIINMVRDGRDVACSTVKMPWGTQDPQENLDRWGCEMERALEQQTWLSDGQYLNVRYEDLVQSTEETLRRVADFLDVGWDDQMIGHEVFATSVGRYREELSPQLQAQALDRWGHLLSQFGYLGG